MKYVRRLNSSEKERFFIKIDADHLPMFPEIKEKFTLIVKNETFEVSIDSQKRLWAFKFRSLLDFSHDTVLEIIKDEKNLYYLDQIDVKQIFKH